MLKKKLYQKSKRAEAIIYTLYVLITKVFVYAYKTVPLAGKIIG